MHGDKFDEYESEFSSLKDNNWNSSSWDEKYEKVKETAVTYLNAGYDALMYLKAIKEGAAEDEVEDMLDQAQQSVQDAHTANLVTVSRMSATIGVNRNPHQEFIDVIDTIVNRGDYYKPTDLDANTADEIEKRASIILTTVTNIGMVISILILAILGIKYMLGSIEEKAEYKKDMIPYLVGAGLAFGITGIVKILMLIGNNLNSI